MIKHVERTTYEIKPFKNNVSFFNWNVDVSKPLHEILSCHSFDMTLGYE